MQKQAVIDQISHRETSVVPYTLSFEGDVAERLDAHYGSRAWRAQIDQAIVQAPIPALGVDLDVTPTVTDPYGTTWQTDRRPFHQLEAPLKEPSLEGYVFPDVDSYVSDAYLAQVRAAIEAAPERFWVVGYSFGLFERTWCLRGFTNALADAASEPAFYAELVEAIAEHQLAIIDKLLTLPIDGIMGSDDWGYQDGILLGPRLWRKFIKPQLARLHKRIHAAGKFTLSHCCGSVAEIMPDLIEIGLDVLESVQPEARGMSPYELKRKYGDEITFWGGLGSQSTVPFGSPAEIRAEVGRLCQHMTRGGGYILAPAKALQPETPTLNAAAVVESFLDATGTPLAL
ncbi:MAG: hypothetical protein GXY68_00565 [Chloroflexi bacterium]|jgi:uroporphyrinogen decarboxylase|nr:hypothetical protein [Chloroflexota bacterium]